MRLHRVDRDVQVGGDLLVRHERREQPEDLPLPVRDPFDEVPGWRRPHAVEGLPCRPPGVPGRPRQPLDDVPQRRPERDDRRPDPAAGGQVDGDGDGRFRGGGVIRRRLRQQHRRLRPRPRVRAVDLERSASRGCRHGRGAVGAPTTSGAQCLLRLVADGDVRPRGVDHVEHPEGDEHALGDRAAGQVGVDADGHAHAGRPPGGHGREGAAHEGGARRRVGVGDRGRRRPAAHDRAPQLGVANRADEARDLAGQPAGRGDQGPTLLVQDARRLGPPPGEGQAQRDEGGAVGADPRPAPVGDRSCQRDATLQIPIAEAELGVEEAHHPIHPWVAARRRRPRARLGGGGACPQPRHDGEVDGQAVRRPRGDGRRQVIGGGEQPERDVAGRRLGGQACRSSVAPARHRGGCVASAGGGACRGVASGPRRSACTLAAAVAS